MGIHVTPPTSPLIAGLRRLYGAAYRFRAAIAVTLYLSVTLIAYAGAYLLVGQLRWPAALTATFWSSAVLLGLIRASSVVAFSLSTARWRFIGTRDVVRLVVATSAGTAIFALVVATLPLVPPVPTSIFVMEWFATTSLTAAMWIGYRLAYEWYRHQQAGYNGSARRVLILGAGEAGNLLGREMQRSPVGLRPIAYLDDDERKWGIRLNGLEVLGATSRVREIAQSWKIDEIIIALPSVSAPVLREVVEHCESTGLPFKALPGIAEVLQGDVGAHQVREVQLEDLLSRKPIELTLPALAAELSGRSVLITGAAGSIGSELARQVARHGPGTLVLFDQAETALFFLEIELRERHPGLRLVAVVGDILDGGAIERVFAEYGPDRVFHAAAYKHVPLMEANPREAVRNNVLGTWRVAEASGRHGVDKFVLVSTDKAVRPVSVMGATKRVAEWVILELQRRHPRTCYAAVRFGNVLGSGGSVIPIFRRQLAEGRPLTVTHPEATRYFMTIPEAVQLILQTSLLDEIRGHIAMLEMGEPVRILDLARNLLALSGKPLGDGGRIVFTGLRPGERLHEELVAPEEETVPTPVAKVRVIRTAGVSEVEILPILTQWDEAISAGAGREIVPQLLGWFGLPASNETPTPLPDPVVRLDRHNSRRARR
jgi:FlaA1/EpsC-like NDP-sugar epimerase